MAGTERKKTTATKKKLACKYCSMVCSTRYSLDEHVRTHTGDRPFLCNLCNTSFKRMMGLRKHQQCVHGAPGLKQYNCPQCKLVSPNLGNVLRHYLVVHKTLRRFICSICLVQYNQNQELKSHLSAKHSIVIGNINSKEKKSICESDEVVITTKALTKTKKKAVNKIYVLPTFDPKDRPNTIITRLKEMVEAEKEKLAGIEKLISVIKNNTETGDTRSICVAANSSSTDVVESSDVISDTINESDHNNEKTNIEERIQLSRTPEEEINNDNCPETWISFVLEKPTILYNEICYENCIPSEIFLDDEQGNSRINKPAAELTVQKTEWKCDVCQKTFPEEKRLCRHLKMHNSEKKYKCDSCDKSFREQHNLVVHYRTHSKERPYVCPVCEKKIRYHKDFVDHFVSHSGEKRYICDYCSKKFPRKRDRDRHMLSHNPEHRFSCEICGKGFSRRYLMLQHVLKHKKTDNQQPVQKEIFECDVCRKHYKTSHRFLQHKTKHTGLTEHQCHICSKSYSSTTRLQAHLRNHIPRVKNVTCSECQRKFSSQDTLKIHMDRFHKPEVLIEVEEQQTLLAVIEVPDYDYEITVNNNFND